jgi:sulfate permease, SulP family
MTAGDAVLRPRCQFADHLLSHRYAVGCVSKKGSVKRRYESLVALLPALRGPGFAMRQALQEGYGAAQLRADLLSGTVVGIVALPLSMALAIATGVPPQHGLYTAIVAGFIIALLGGSRVQVSGPTAAFIVILAPIANQHGVNGLLVATLMAGVILLLMGLARLGRMVTFIPYPVTTGFTAGIGVVIATLQIKDFLGLTIPGRMPDEYIGKVETLIHALPTWRWPDLSIGLLTLATLLLWPRVTRKIPAPLVAVAGSGVLAWLLTRFMPGFSVETIASRFSHVVEGVTHQGIPQVPPMPVLPWRVADPSHPSVELSLDLIRTLLPSAFAIAMLGAIESLLSAVVSDGMTGQKHNSDAELMAQGVGNMVAPFFGGIAATGAIARTATNVRSGGRSPVAAAFHAVFVLASVLVLAPVLGHLPLASLAALLLIVAWNMSEAKHFVRMVRIAPRSDVFVLLTCFGLTVVFDMVIAVGAGVLLAAILFMRRMAEVAQVELVGDHHPELDAPLPKGVLLYEIAGPLFFGAAQKAMSELHEIDGGEKIVVLDMDSVHAMDTTGLVNLESTIHRLHRDKVFVILASVQPQPMSVIERAGLDEYADRLAVFSSFDDAIAEARRRAQPAS